MRNGQSSICRWKTFGETTGYRGGAILVIQGGSRRFAPEMVQAVAAFQHLVTADLPVALLVVARPKAIQSLRREPALGWLSRAEAIGEPTG